MSDLQSEQGVAFPAPFGFVARAILGCDKAVQSVLVVGKGGGMVAYERSLGSEDKIPFDSEFSQLMFYSPKLGMLISLLIDRKVASAEIEAKVRSIVETPSPILSQ